MSKMVIREKTFGDIMRYEDENLLNEEQRRHLVFMEQQIKGYPDHQLQLYANGAENSQFNSPYDAVRWRICKKELKDRGFI